MGITPELKIKPKEEESNCYFLELWLSKYQGIQNDNWTGVKKTSHPFIQVETFIHFIGGKWYSTFRLRIHRLRIALYFID